MHVNLNKRKVKDADRGMRKKGERNPIHTEMATMWNTYLGNWVSLPSSIPTTPLRHKHVKPLHCAPFQQQVEAEGVGGSIMCEPCNGKGWLLCDFCKGQKTNVKADNNRFYRRCPSCRSVGFVLCSSCKVFKCVTFPNFNDNINS